RRPQRQLRADRRPGQPAARAQGALRALRHARRHPRNAALQALGADLGADGGVPQQVPEEGRRDIHVTAKVKRAGGLDTKITKSGTQRSRRALWSLCLLCGLCASAAGSCSGGREFSVAPSADRSILLVTIDTLRADALGAYGGRASTPNLDALASHGARFDFAHAHAVVTLVSHA